MTIQEAIETSDSLRPSRFDGIEKVKWLSALDRRIKSEIIDTHEENEEISGTFIYDESTNLQEKLLVPDPYSELYIHYIISQIDFYNGEYARYNNSAGMFNQQYNEFSRWYNREHMPLQSVNPKKV